MEFQVFKSMDEAQRQLPYPIVVVDNLLGTPRTSHIRWLDPSVDVFFQTFTGLTRAPNGDLLASKLLVLIQGRGSRASLSTAPHERVTH